jgi:hypothetical protein
MMKNNVGLQFQLFQSHGFEEKGQTSKTFSLGERSLWNRTLV